MSTAVGEYLLRMMDLRSLNRTQVAALSGVDAGYMNKIRSGEIKEPSVEKVRKLAKAVGGAWLHVGWLLSSGASNERGRLLAEAYFRAENREALSQDQKVILAELMRDPEAAAAIVAAIDMRRGNDPD